MFGKRRVSEIVLSKTNMFVLSFSQKVIEFVWQDKRPEIIHSSIFIKEMDQDLRDPIYKCEFSASINDRGTLVEVRVRFELCNADYVPKGKVHSWTPVTYIAFEVRSVRGLRDLQVGFNVTATWGDNPVILCDGDGESQENLRSIWAELGLPTNIVVRT